MSKTMYGSGTLWATPASGDTTPRRFGILSEASVEFTSTVKELHGQDDFPEEVASGKRSLTLKAKNATIGGAFFNSIFFGNGVISSGHDKTAELEAAAIPDTSGPYTVTVSNAVSFKDDLGVVYADTADSFKRVDGAPAAAGEYQVSPAGIYTFHVGDKAKGILISYTYAVAGSGETLTVSGQKMGTAPKFSVHLYGKYDGRQATLKLFSVVSTKLALAFKNEDFTVPDLEAKGMKDAAGRVFAWSYSWK